MKKLNILFIPEILRWKISIRWLTVAIPLSAVPCTAALIVEILNLYLSDVTAGFVLLAGTNIPWNALPVCPSNWLTFNIATAFSLLMKTFEISFSKTVLFLTVFFILLPVLFPGCFSNWISLKILPPGSLWFYIHLAVILNGILTSTAWSPKVDTVMTDSGVTSNISTTLIFVMHSALHCLMN